MSGMFCLHTKPVVSANRATRSDWHGEWHGVNLHPELGKYPGHLKHINKDHPLHSQGRTVSGMFCLHTNEPYVSAVPLNLTGTASGTGESPRGHFRCKGNIQNVWYGDKLVRTAVWEDKKHDLHLNTNK